MYISGEAFGDKCYWQVHRANLDLGLDVKREYIG